MHFGRIRKSRCRIKMGMWVGRRGVKERARKEVLMSQQTCGTEMFENTIVGQK